MLHCWVWLNPWNCCTIIWSRPTSFSFSCGGFQMIMLLSILQLARYLFLGLHCKSKISPSCPRKQAFFVQFSQLFILFAPPNCQIMIKRSSPPDARNFPVFLDQRIVLTHAKWLSRTQSFFGESVELGTTESTLLFVGELVVDLDVVFVYEFLADRSLSFICSKLQIITLPLEVFESCPWPPVANLVPSGWISIEYSALFDS